MATSVYTINKGINRPIEFKGLKAQYIAYLAVGLVALLLLFTALFLAGVPLPVCLPLILLAGGGLFAGTYHLNRTYGQYGLLKRLARRRLPACVRLTSRNVFLSLTQPAASHDRAC
ncbi:protein of unknown function [Pontibacter indicus]|uniref:DUF4133 domain-containing protein n=2 Tax=Pontibacter indicus TaxID=1317125 RepID=A0A1R3XTM8_9BACT|nr:protein of unknown function [Pontibacter indicus]